MTQLVGHVALVTGGNSGIGLGLATGLARAGASVAIWGTNIEKIAAAAERLKGLGAAVHTERCDVGDEQQVEEAFARTISTFGKVDSAFANAGISGDSPRFVDLTLEEWRRVLSVNLDGAFLTLRAAARHLVERDEGGSLVAVSSTSAIHGAPRKQAYAVSKTGLVALVRSLAVELAKHRVRVNALLPGWTDTDLLGSARHWTKFVENTVARTPVGRWADPEEFADVAVFLADPTITYHTGDTMVMDGGYTLF